MHTCKGCLESFETLIAFHGKALCGDCTFAAFNLESVRVKRAAQAKRTARALKRMRRIDHIAALAASNNR